MTDSKNGANEYWVPGIRAVETLIQHQPERILGVWQSGDEHRNRARIVAQAQSLHIPVHTASIKKLNERFPRVQHQGICARVEPSEYASWSELLAVDNALIVAVDQVTDPRNFGAILRSAEAMGATGALTTRNRAARINSTVSKTSAGASEVLPVAMESNLARALRAAQELGFQIVGADLDGQAPSKIDLTGPTVIVVGAEGRGLRRLTKEICDEIATVPLCGKIESLNASVAAGILVYEVSRQRQKKSLSGKVHI